MQSFLFVLCGSNGIHCTCNGCVLSVAQWRNRVSKCHSYTIVRFASQFAIIASLGFVQEYHFYYKVASGTGGKANPDQSMGVNLDLVDLLEEV